jgi:hypothetical protein
VLKKHISQNLLQCNKALTNPEQSTNSKRASDRERGRAAARGEGLGDDRRALLGRDL